MKTLIIVAILIGNSIGLSSALASQPKKSMAKSNKNLGTDFNFSDMTVKGKYQYADEAAAIVENEKDIDDLLQPRKHFKDRLNQSTSRQ